MKSLILIVLTVTLFLIAMVSSGLSFDTGREEAKAVQRFLNEKGYLDANQVDGIYGKKTWEAAEQFTLDQDLYKPSEISKNRTVVAVQLEYSMFIKSQQVVVLHYFNEYVLKKLSGVKKKPKLLYLHNWPGTSHAIVRIRPEKRIVNNKYFVNSGSSVKVLDDFTDRQGSRWVKIYIPDLKRNGYVVPDQIKGY